MLCKSRAVHINGGRHVGVWTSSRSGNPAFFLPVRCEHRLSLCCAAAQGAAGGSGSAQNTAQWKSFPCLASLCWSWHQELEGSECWLCREPAFRDICRVILHRPVREVPQRGPSMPFITSRGWRLHGVTPRSLLHL